MQSGVLPIYGQKINVIYRLRNTLEWIKMPKIEILVTSVSRSKRPCIYIRVQGRISPPGYSTWRSPGGPPWGRGVGVGVL